MFRKDCYPMWMENVRIAKSLRNLKQTCICKSYIFFHSAQLISDFIVYCSEIMNKEAGILPIFLSPSKDKTCS